MNKKISLSLCMIVKDEEKTLERCLNSVKTFIDEIIIVDTGSIDSTKEIAKKFGSKIYDFKWINDFSAARNYSFSKATSDYIMWLDGDDYIKEENIEKIEKTFQNFDISWDYISAKYVLSRTVSGEISSSSRRNRIVRRAYRFKWIGNVHEYLDVFGNGHAEDFQVEHGKVKKYTNRNLNIFKEMEKNEKQFTPRDIFYYANELKDNFYYEDAINKYGAFLNTKKGWIEDVKTSYVRIIDCLKFLDKKDEIPTIAFESFKYDVPRAEICCHLAEYYLDKGSLNQAIFWYRIALDCAPEKNSLAVQNSNYYTWIPALQLCLCYFKIGNINASYFFNEFAASFIPDSEKIEYNRNYFSQEYGNLGIEKPSLESPIKLSDYKLYI